MSEKIDNGHCLCGAVKFKVEGNPIYNVICHCENCRRQGGSIMHCASIFLKKQYTLLTPDAPLKTYNDSATQSGQALRRVFCTNCGTKVSASTPLNEDIISVPAGVLEKAGADWIPHKEQFVRDKVTTWLPDFEHACEEMAKMNPNRVKVTLDKTELGPGGATVSDLK